MSVNRVQKLLFSEYCDFEDMVLIESPFAQTTRDGIGIRQVYLGLTPTKLVLATDVMPPVEQSCFYFNPGIDPDIETFELIAIYPVECVNLSIFCRQKRKALKAHFCNNKILYFELGGFEKRDMFWNLWRERIKFLCPDECAASSKSQTSVASSSTSSTLYLVESREVRKANGMKQVWCKFGTGNAQLKSKLKWTDRHLYMGKNSEDAQNYKPIASHPKLKHFVKHASFTRNKMSPTVSQMSTHVSSSQGSGSLVNRFGHGIKENCSSSLILLSRDGINHTNKQGFVTGFMMSNQFLTYAEDIIKLWEHNVTKNKKMHKQRYRFSPYPYFLQGLGPWNLHPGSTYSVQIKRAASTIFLKNQPLESELRLPISRRQLLATISCDHLNTDRIINRPICNSRPAILFWTPCYWYRPRIAKTAYEELRRYLKIIQKWRERTESKRYSIQKLYTRKILKNQMDFNSDFEIDSLEQVIDSTFKRKNNFGIKNSNRNVDGCWCLFSYILDKFSDPKENSLEQIKHSLKIDVILTAWDFDSSTLAIQLTIIDRDLFLRVNTVELGILSFQQSSKNAPNISAMIAFAHRITCLVGNEILREESEKVRARLITRFINVAEKCHRMLNFNSCKTILYGLQSPSIFRLKHTWQCVRKKHSSVYQNYKYLCKIYRDERLHMYQKTFSTAKQNDPYLPYIGDLLSKLNGKVPNYERFKIHPNKKHVADTHFIPMSSLEDESNIQKYLKLFKQWISLEDKKNHLNNETSNAIEHNYQIKGKQYFALDDYYPPLNKFLDNKHECLQTMKRYLCECQLAAMKYTLKRNELAHEYLLKTRYREHKENFYRSLKIEP